MSQSKLETFTIYGPNQREYPGLYVVRRWTIDQIGALRPGPAPFHLSESLDDARKSIPPGMIAFQRNKTDDPSIVETWI